MFLLTCEKRVSTEYYGMCIRGECTEQEAADDKSLLRSIWIPCYAIEVF